MNILKNQIKRVLTLLLVATLLLSCVSLLLSCSSDGGASLSVVDTSNNNDASKNEDAWSFEFGLNEDGKSYAITGATPPSSTKKEDLTFPDTYEGLPVTVIKITAPLTYVRNVVIPNTVTTIEGEMFREPSNLKTVTFGSGVTSIVGEVFADATALEEIIVPSIECWLNISMSESIFLNKPQAKLIAGGRVITSIMVPESITEIKAHAFDGYARLENVELTSYIATIGEGAFKDTSITSLSIPNGVTTIGEYAFQNTPIALLYIPDDITEIGAGAFSGCKNLREVTIEKGVKEIKHSTFSNCNNLEKFTFGSAVKIIEDTAFKNCDNLNEIIYNGTFDQFSETYGNYAFPESIDIYTNVTCTATWGDWVVVKEPTCKSEGLRTRTSSSGYVQEEIIPFGDHVYATVPSVKPTCEEEGLSNGAYCSVCDAILSEQYTLDAKGHTYQDGICATCGQPQPVDVWDGTSDTSWYKDSETTFTITNAKQLAGFATLVNNGRTMKGKTFYLDADIDLNNKAWAPIGYYNSFEGVFDGKDHTIYNLKITGSPGGYGLFGANVGTIKNLSIENATLSVTSASTVGVLLGRNDSIEWSESFGTVDNCHVKGTITIDSITSSVYVGGLIGNHKYCSILKNSSADVDITITTGANDSGQTMYAGGLVGNIEGEVSGCYATGDVSVTTQFASVYGGGLIGRSGSSNIRNCYATGNVTISSTNATMCAGGLVGEFSGSLNTQKEVMYCYATGDVSASNQSTSSTKTYAGGLIGSVRLDTAVVQCYATGDVSSTVKYSATGLSHAYAGALIGGIPTNGANTLAAVTCYYAAEQTITVSGSNTHERTDGLVQYLSTIQSKNFFTDMIEWSSSVWDFENGGYPTLK